MMEYLYFASIGIGLAIAAWLVLMLCMWRGGRVLLGLFFTAVLGPFGLLAWWMFCRSTPRSNAVRVRNHVRI